MKNQKLQEIFKIIPETNLVKIKINSSDNLGIVPSVMLKYDNEHTKIIFECYQDAREVLYQTKAPQGLTIKQVIDIISNVDKDEEINVTLNRFYHWGDENAFVSTEKDYFISCVEFKSDDEDMLVLVLEKKEKTNNIAA